MNLSDQILAALVQYGLPVLFGVVLMASTGVPLPASLLLITAGSFVTQGSFNFWQVVVLGICAAVLGDNTGYAAGRWGGQWLRHRLTAWLGGADRFKAAERTTRRWGGLGVFLSRWLFTPLGPVLNLTSGMAAYSWFAFFCYDLAGEAVWVGGYVSMGRVFSDQVQTLDGLLGDIGWISLGIVAALGLGAMLLRSMRRPRLAEAAIMAAGADHELQARTVARD